MRYFVAHEKSRHATPADALRHAGATSEQIDEARMRGVWTLDLGEYGAALATPAPDNGAGWVLWQAFVHHSVDTEGAALALRDEFAADFADEPGGWAVFGFLERGMH